MIVMERDKLSYAIEDYLKVIYELTLCEQSASTSSIAGRLGVKPGSVSGMLKRLAANDPPLIVYRKHRGVELTGAGEKIALELIRHHRLIELYLHQALGYPWDEVHQEADRLEHVISENLEERIAGFLGNPSRDPHGDPIPSRELTMPPSSSTSLYELRPGQKALVQRINNEESELLRYCESLGLVPGARLKITAFSPFDENLHLQVNGEDADVVVGPAISREIYVEVL
jgi:DtxR family Mn-dependent transcriptional regulator